MALVIGAVAMVALPLIVGIGLIVMLVLNRNNAQPQPLPTLASTQVIAPTQTALAVVSSSTTLPTAQLQVTATNEPNQTTVAASPTAISASPTPSGANSSPAPVVATNTPNPLSIATATNLPPSGGGTATRTPVSATATSSAQNTATPTLTPSPTATAPGAGITVKSTRWFYDADYNLVRVVGEVTNNTNSQQLIETLASVFYSAPGVTVNPNDVIDLAPQEVIPVGGTVPFYFELDNVTSLSSYTVTVQTDQSPFVTRTDLVIEDQTERTDDEGQRCIEGKVRNPGDRLQNEVVVVATIYDDQNNLVNFSYDYFDSGATFQIFGDRTRSFSACVRTPHTGRVDLRAYGR